MSSNTLLLTKGCFVHKGSGKKKKKSELQNEFDGLHFQQYKHLWNELEQKIKDIEKNAYKETFDSLINFVKNYYVSNQIEIDEIPAAVLIMGVNMPDHSNIFHLLEQRLYSNGIAGTVILKSRDCNNFCNLLQKLITGLTEKFLTEEELENIVLKKLDCTFAKLLKYYEKYTEVQIETPRKSKSKQKSVTDVKSQPLVILIQDVEAFHPDVLQDLILNCSLYINRLPIVLVFGMASAMVTLHNVLSQKALSHLGIETFYSMSAIEYLTKVINEIVISPEYPFKLGPNVFKLIVDTVLYHDFSMTNLAAMLKFCMIKHFSTGEITALCCKSVEIPKKLSQLSAVHLEKFKKLPSLMSYLDKNPNLKSSLKDENKFKVILKQHLEEMHDSHQLSFLLIKCLHLLTKDLPSYPLGKQLREVYALALEDITLCPNYVQAMKLLRMHSKDELIEKLKLCLELLCEPSDINKNSVLCDMQIMLKKFIEELDNVQGKDCEKEKVTEALDIENVKSRYQLQEKIKARLVAQRSKFDTYRGNIIDYLSSIFKNTCLPIQLPLHEVFYFDNAAAVKQHLMAVPRVTIHKALMNPRNYLQCSCCKISDSREILSSMPDICILYKLYLECGKLINLYDWLEAFKSVKDASSDKRRNYKKNDKYDSELNIRFFQAVSELHLLGFIKSTKRKTDHVARLTFGSF